MILLKHALTGKTFLHWKSKREGQYHTVLHGLSGLSFVKVCGKGSFRSNW